MKNANPHVVARRVGSGAVLVHLQTNQVFELNDTAARVWELVCDGIELHEMGRRLAEEFDVSSERAEMEAAEVLARFRDEGFLA